MKNILLAGLLLLSSFGFSQNINENKVSFTYTQLPLIKIDEKFKAYEVRVEHLYKKANEDSSLVQQQREQLAKNTYDQQLAIYYKQRDSLDKSHLLNLAMWEKKVNSGILNPDGTPLAQPIPPVYPQAPTPTRLNPVILHSDLDQSQFTKSLNIEGFSKGLGGFIVTVDVYPIRYQPVVETKSGTGATIKYSYALPYVLPIHVKVESPTQGVLYDQVLFDMVKRLPLKDFPSRYEFAIYEKENRASIYKNAETSARQESLNAINSLLNDQFGYVVKTRVAEIFSVKGYKNYEYSDVTKAYTLTMQALQLIKNDRDRSAAKAKLQAAFNEHVAILEESNLVDNKARINDKITAMLQCNQVEILYWLTKYDEAQILFNIVANSGEGKAKRYIRDQEWFYADLKKRWEVSFGL